MRSARTFLPVLLFSLTACRQDMHDQPRIEPLQRTTLFADGRGSRPLVTGTIARGQLKTDKEYTLGRHGLAKPAAPGGAAVAQAAAAQRTPAPAAHQHAADEKAGAPASFDPDLVAEFPITITREILQRGRQRFEIFCVHCHGYTGSGNGMIVQRGLSKPPSFHTDRLKQAPVGHFFDVVTNGFGAMYSYASRIPVADRWAIIAYVRTLQVSQSANVADVPESERAKLQKPQTQPAAPAKEEHR
jgi:mono/diheme cytochrome c family protein